MNSTYGPETTITIGMLQAGDWIDTIPTQSGVRGIRLQSAVESVREDMMDTWSVSTGRGRRRTVVESVVIRTRLRTLTVPADFEVVVRRPL